MAAVISLWSEVIEAMEMTGGECVSYLNPETGEIFTVTEEDRLLVEEESSDDAALESDLFVEMPDLFDIHEW